jgi:hypothetical protein
MNHTLASLNAVVVLIRTRYMLAISRIPGTWSRMSQATLAIAEKIE